MAIQIVAPLDRTTVILELLSLNHHLTVVERFAYPNDSSELSCLELYAPLGSPMADWSERRGQTKNGSTPPPLPHEL